MTLVEQIVAIGIVGTILAASLGAVATGAVGLNTAISRNRAVHLAMAQMEFVKNQTFVAAPTSYPVESSPVQGFSVSAVAEPVSGADSNLQRVMVTVVRGGKTVIRLEDLKVNRP